MIMAVTMVVTTAGVNPTMNPTTNNDDGRAVEQVADTLSEQREACDLRAAHEHGIGLGRGHGNHPASASNELSLRRSDSNEKCSRASRWL